MILLEVAVNLFTRTWFRIRSVTSARQACRKIAVLSLIRSQRQLACEGLYWSNITFGWQHPLVRTNKSTCQAQGWFHLSKKFKILTSPIGHVQGWFHLSEVQFHSPRTSDYLLIPKTAVTHMHFCVTRGRWVNTLRLRQNGHHFPDDIFKCIFLNENIWISIKISLKFVPKGPVNNVPPSDEIMVLHPPGARHYLNQWWLDYPHTCVTQPRWANGAFLLKAMRKKSSIDFWSTSSI